jgi:hypothetical protein
MLTNNDNLKRYLSLFRGREDYFAQQYDSGYNPVPRSLDLFDLSRHLAGDETYGIYLLNKESYCYLFCIDIDILKAEISGMKFKDRTEKFGYLGKKLQETIIVLTEHLKIPRAALLLEETGGRGYHIWILLNEAVSGDNAISFSSVLKKYLTFEIEFFPKQGQLSSKRKLGNLIKLPLGIHRKYKARSVFFTLSGSNPIYEEGIERNLDMLAKVIPLEASVIITAIKENPGTFKQTKRLYIEPPERELLRPLYKGDIKTLTNRCAAIGRIYAKAEKSLELTYTEAFHFTNILLSADQGQSYIIKTLQDSYGLGYNEKNTLSEIERIRLLLPTSCASLVEQSICPGYCREGIRKRNTDPLLRATTPCSVWLTKLRSETHLEYENLSEQIGMTSNIRKSFFQLKAYHEYEDSLFFDPFDFEQFQKDLSSNCEIFAAILREKSIMPFGGYLTVEIPKKLDSDYSMVNRKMAYSTVYDQVPIQAVFNIIAPLIELDFQDSSYGYRWNSDSKQTNNIFYDWRESYPNFRSHILSALHRNPNGFHICCDIKGYYDHVVHEILIEQLRSTINDQYVFEYICKIIESYRYDKNEAKGLPQGPAYARVLANLYLNDFDKNIDRNAAEYFRYVDDLFLFFDSTAEAERGLLEVVKYLKELGLELSDAEDKKPTIISNADESRVRWSLDQIQYGILEGTRQLKNLDHNVVSDFSKAIERHQVSPATIDELLELNCYMPSLLYVVTEESLISHPLRGKVWAIVNYLIEHNWFYPKKLKMVFYRLLDLSPNDKELIDLYNLMQPVHKVYFILSVYGAYLSSGNHEKLLEALTTKAVKDEYVFLRGFAIAIGNRLNLNEKLCLSSVPYIKRYVPADEHFLIGKWIGEFSYLSLGDDEKAAIRELVSPKCKSYIKSIFLGTLSNSQLTYLDGKYLCNIIKNGDEIILPTVCSAIISASNWSDLLEHMLKFIDSYPKLKPSIISILSTKLFDLRSGSGRIQIENLKALYDQIPDQEIKRVLKLGLVRILGDAFPDAEGSSFIKSHKDLDRYNECFLFEYIGQSAEYDSLELIPVSKFQQYIPNDLNSIKIALEDLSEKEVLPTLLFLYDSGSDEINLKYLHIKGLKLLSKSDFQLNSESILYALRIAVQVYKKACYFYRVINKAPLIQADNLLINESGDTVVFRTLGKSLSSPYLIDGVAIGDEEVDISRMVGMLLSSLLFCNAHSVKEYLKKDHSGIESFLSLFIKNMSARAYSDAYSCARFEYIVEQLLIVSKEGKDQFLSLYMKERLKASLYKRYNSYTSWYGVLGTVSDQVSHLREACNRETIRIFPYRNRLVLSTSPIRQLHWISRQLLNMTVNLRCKSIESILDSNYLDLIIHLMLFSIVSIETLTLSTCLRKKFDLNKIEIPAACELIHVNAAGYERDYKQSEILQAKALYPAEIKYEENQDAWASTVSLIMLRILLFFEVHVEKNNMQISDGGIIPKQVFKNLAHACLIRIPRIEDELELHVKSALEALQNNDEIIQTNSSIHLDEEIKILAHDFKNIRKLLRIKRSFGVANGQKYFPPDIKCKSFFHRSIIVKEPLLSGFPLTNRFPSSKYHCSWDVHSDTILSLVIPDEGLNSLLSDIKSGKFFGFKLSYLYSGKMMLLYDGLFATVTSLLLIACEYAKTALQDRAVWSAILNASSKVLEGSVTASIAKIVLWDIGHWIPGWILWIKSLRSANDKDN